MRPYWSEVTAAVFAAPRPDFALTGSVGAALPSRYAVTPFAAATIAAAGQGVADLMETDAAVSVDAASAALWFDRSVAPVGWEMRGIWDAIAGNYRAADGWIRLHTNAPRHRDAALAVLACAPTRAAVTEAVRRWTADNLETEIVAAGGAAARMRPRIDWAAHPQGAAVGAEPLVHWDDHGPCAPRPLQGRDRPLAGVRVLDLTRVLAGPVATRFLAGFGAEVLRIDPPDWDEPAVTPDVTLGKRCAGLDLRDAADRATFDRLLASADILVHGYRPGALDGLGYGAAARRALAPALVEVTLCAYGWTGPWAGRRGFDSLVQMSSGIAARAKGDDPDPLPVQALDHGTGYLMAACALRALKARAEGRLLSARLSLARTGEALCALAGDPEAPGLAPGAADWSPTLEETGWGPARRLRPPVRVGALTPSWPLPAGPLRRHAAAWTA